MGHSACSWFPVALWCTSVHCYTSAQPCAAVFLRLQLLPPGLASLAVAAAAPLPEAQPTKQTNKQTYFNFEIQLLYYNGYVVAIRAIGTLNCLVTGSSNSIGAPLARQALGTPAFHMHTRAHTPGLLDSSLPRRSSIERLS